VLHITHIFDSLSQAWPWISRPHMGCTLGGENLSSFVGVIIVLIITSLNQVRLEVENPTSQSSGGMKSRSQRQWLISRTAFVELIAASLCIFQGERNCGRSREFANQFFNFTAREGCIRLLPLFFFCGIYGIMKQYLFRSTGRRKVYKSGGAWVAMVIYFEYTY